MHPGNKLPQTQKEEIPAKKEVTPQEKINTSPRQEVPKLNFDNTLKLQYWNAYPNPIDDQINIQYELDKSSDVQFNLYDNLGQLILQKELQQQNSGEHQIQMQVPDISSGHYQLQWLVDGLSFSRQVIKN